ncbi:PilN domain-containing protein [Cellulomonas sp. URHB0016]
MNLTMTLGASKTKSKGSAKGSTFVVGLPQVNLLPPEVKAARGLVNVKRWLGLSLVFVLAMAALTYGFAFLENQAAQGELADAQQENQRLMQEQAKYAEVPAVLTELNRFEKARTLGMGADILWKSYLDSIAAVLPPGVSIDTFTISQATAWSAGQTVSDPLIEPGMGSILFTVRTSTLPDDAAWLDALNSIPGLGDATMSSAGLTQTEGAPYYAVTSSVQVLEPALSLRFIPTEEN